MENVYVKTDVDSILKEYFKEDIVSLEDILIKLDEVTFEKNSLQDDIEELREDIRNNYILKSDYYH